MDVLLVDESPIESIDEVINNPLYVYKNCKINLYYVIIKNLLDLIMVDIKLLKLKIKMLKIKPLSTPYNL